MVDEVLTHARQRKPDADAVLREHLRVADAGEFEYLRGVDRPRAENDFPARPHLLQSSAHVAFDTDGSLAFEHDSVRERIRQDGQIVPRARGTEVAVRCTHSPASTNVGLCLAHSFLALAVVVGIARQTDRLAGGKQRIVERTLVHRFAHVDRSTRGAPLVGVMLVVLDSPKERQQVVVAPSPVAELCPGIEIEWLAADVHETVDGAGTAEHPTSRNRYRPVSRTCLRLGLKAPVHGRIVDELAVAQRKRNPGMPVLGPCLEQEDAVLSRVGESIGEHAARRPRAHDDVVEGVDVSFPS